MSKYVRILPRAIGGGGLYHCLERKSLQRILENLNFTLSLASVWESFLLICCFAPFPQLQEHNTHIHLLPDGSTMGQGAEIS